MVISLVSAAVSTSSREAAYFYGDLEGETLVADFIFCFNSLFLIFFYSFKRCFSNALVYPAVIGAAALDGESFSKTVYEC